MEGMSWVTIVAGLIGVGGLGAFLREIVSMISLARKGVSGREDRRKSDIISQRDHARDLQLEAEKGERAADHRADAEAEKRRHWQEEYYKLRRQAIEQGLDPGPVPHPVRKPYTGSTEI